MSVKKLLVAAAALSGAAVLADAGNINDVKEVVLGEARVTVDPAVVVGPIKPMHGVNDAEPPGSALGDQKRGSWQAFQTLKIPFIRTHDAASMFECGGAHMGDVTAMFPDFEADENDPANYDFALTDWVLSHWRTSGAEIFFRLGQTIEHWPKKYGTRKPADFAKWARICEHVILHYNEGWADGHRWNIRYWEIWNEPDLDEDDSKNKRCWGGTKAEFFEFYRVAATHLKSRFPNLRIGGPALAFREQWGCEFIAYCRDVKAPLDFFSWHGYISRREDLPNRARVFREALDGAGFTAAESICDEWNYVTDWSSGFLRSVEQLKGIKGAALVMSTMNACQSAPVDSLMYYDTRSDSAFNGVFDSTTWNPLKGYWAFYAWRRLYEYGTQVKTTLEGDAPSLSATAARAPDGRLRLVLARFTGDDNFFHSHKVRVAVKGRRLASGVAKLVDDGYSYGEVEFPVTDGEIEVSLRPNAFVFIDLERTASLGGDAMNR